MNIKLEYRFTAVSWQHSSPGGWCFVSLPDDVSKEIRANHQWQEEGWGRLKAIAKIGKTEWSTAIWFDTKSDVYILPLKSEIRKKENLSVGSKCNVSVWI